MEPKLRGLRRNHDVTQKYQFSVFGELLWLNFRRPPTLNMKKGAFLERSTSKLFSQFWIRLVLKFRPPNGKNELFSAYQKANLNNYTWKRPYGHFHGYLSAIRPTIPAQFFGSPPRVGPKSAHLARSVLGNFFLAKISSIRAGGSADCQKWVKTPCFFLNLGAKNHQKSKVLRRIHDISQKSKFWTQDPLSPLKFPGPPLVLASKVHIWRDLCSNFF